MFWLLGEMFNDLQEAFVNPAVPMSRRQKIVSVTMVAVTLAIIVICFIYSR